MDTKPVRNSQALESLTMAMAYLTIAAVKFGQKDQAEQEKAAEILLDSAHNLWKQVTK